MSFSLKSELFINKRKATIKLKEFNKAQKKQGGFPPKRREQGSVLREAN
ncbi:MAG: hypothetical protein LBC53_01675 [Spirochaetaceae bacterium]|jgi:hypothetical protein|nr:hypothetical protein [Spirochaetaceae bacterium]